MNSPAVVWISPLRCQQNCPFAIMKSTAPSAPPPLPPIKSHFLSHPTLNHARLLPVIPYNSRVSPIGTMWSPLCRFVYFNSSAASPTFGSSYVVRHSSSLPALLFLSAFMSPEPVLNAACSLFANDQSHVFNGRIASDSSAPQLRAHHQHATRGH
jgi:hypothetical protein